MISTEKQQGLLLAISNRLKKRINVYAIGGTAMMFLGLKNATLDIDLVFENLEDREAFKEAITSLGYVGFDSKVVYGGKKNKPEMFTLGDERFDLFITEVIDFFFSENMKKRALKKHQFGENLIIKIADPHDIILMKCATDRIKDIDDARSIIDFMKIDWGIILREAEHQVKLGKPRALFDLGYFIERLEKQFKISIPKEISDQIWKKVVGEIKRKQNSE